MTITVVVLLLVTVALWPGARVAPAAVGVDTVGRRGAAASRWWPRRSADPADLEGLAEVAELLAMSLRSGATPVTAVRVVAGRAREPWAEVLRDVGEHLATGDDVGRVWRRRARARPELGPLASAWQLSDDLGVPLAPSMSTSAQVLRARVRGQQRLDAATAGARATMRMLTLLPLAGLLTGTAFGLTPWEVYGHSALTLASAGLGLLLTGVGWLVCHWVLRRAAAPEQHP